MSPPSAPVVLVTGAAKRLGRDIALALARAGWCVAVHYRGSETEAIKTVADCAAFTGACAHFHADLSDEAATRALLPQVVAQMGRVDAVVNNAALFAHDAPASFSYAAMEQHLRANTGAGLAHPPRAAPGHRGGGEPAGPKAVEPKPRFFKLHPVQGRLGSRQYHAGHRAGAAPAGGGRSPGPHLVQPHDDRREVSGAAPYQSLGAQLDFCGCVFCGTLCLDQPVHHWHHAAGRRRPPKSSPSMACASRPIWVSWPTKKPPRSRFK
jgi:hypothetical protein